MIPLNCSTLPCKNGATCYDSKNLSSNSYIGYKCYCSEGYEGDQCEISIKSFRITLKKLLF